jgi:hypothetical protein
VSYIAAHVKSRWIIVTLALGAAMLFALSVIGGEWWTISDVASIGPFGSRRCFVEGDCRATGLAWVGGDSRWMRIGMATWAAGMIAMLALAALAATAASNRSPKLLAKLVMSAVLTAALAGAAFVALFPGLEAAALGRGSILFAIGVVLGLASALLLVRAAHARLAPNETPAA